MKRLSIYISIVTILSACNLSKKLPQDKKLYAGYEIKYSDSSAVLNKKELAELDLKISENLQPKPNTSLFGFPVKVWFHYAIGEPKKKRGIRNFLQDKIGEKPVFFSITILDYNKRFLENLLNNKGYFKSEVYPSSMQEKYKEKAIFTLNVNPRYTIESYRLSSRDFALFNAKDTVDLLNKTFLKPSKPYDLEQILQERTRVASLLQEKGYFYVSESIFEMQADTNLGNAKVNFVLKVAANTNPVLTQPYRIRDIKILSAVKNDQLSQDSTGNDLQSIRKSGAVSFGNNQVFKSKVFTESILFRQGDSYSKSKQNASLNRLTNLKNFQFIRNKFDLVNGIDSSLLDVSYFLTPIKRKSIKFQLSGLTKSNGLYGSEASLAWQNKNLFHGAEILKIEVNGGIDLQLGQSQFGNNYRRLGVQGDLTFPRFLIPFKSQKSTWEAGGVPKTNINLSYEVLRRKDFYSQNSSNFGLTYLWRKNVTYEHSLSPIYFNLIKSSNFSDNFLNQIFFSDNPFDIDRYFQILESRLILGLEYKLNYTPQFLQTNGNKAAFTFGFDMSGNVASLLAPASPDGAGGFKTLWNVPYEQFAKFDMEARYFKTVGKLTWANRLFTGFGIPYKNSIILPQNKQYFSGGNNGLRGFRGRSLGPGSVSPQDITQSLFGSNSQGDIKLEYNTEFRYKVSSYVELATFWDNGNVWTYRDDTFYGPKAKFTNAFLKEIASDFGLGLRLDFTYLIIRGDLAIPIRKPWLTDNPWVINEIQLRNKVWRQENLIFNIAIGHPF